MLALVDIVMMCVIYLFDYTISKFYRLLHPVFSMLLGVNLFTTGISGLG
jgi:hypothetical protein